MSPTRVESGTDGITSHTGDWHAQASQSLISSDFTRWAGYTDTFPEEGYSTSVWVYLDLAAGVPNDTRFDLSSAINTITPEPATTHRRDFVFNVGYYDDTDSTGTGPRFVINASNGGGRAAAFPKDPARDPFTVTASGWYEFRHVFYDNGGVLAVDLELRSDAGALLHSWTLSDSTDIIDVTVGGNRYGWFVIQEFPVLAFDDTRLDVARSTPTDSTQCKDGGWMDFVGDDGEPFKNQGDCVSSVNSGKG